MDINRSFAHFNLNPGSDSAECHRADEEPPKEKGFLIFKAYGVRNTMISRDFVLNIVPLG